MTSTKRDGKETKMQLDCVRVGVNFDVDKRSTGSYAAYYGSRPMGAGKLYHYKALRQLGLQPGDFCVVSTPTHGLTVVTVKSVDDFPLSYYNSLYPCSLKWVVDKVDVDQHETMEKLAARKNELEVRLRGMAEEAKRRLDYKELLRGDPLAMQMMDELKDLGWRP